MKENKKMAEKTKKPSTDFLFYDYKL